jgi:hypothetical protein
VKQCAFAIKSFRKLFLRFQIESERASSEDALERKLIKNFQKNALRYSRIDLCFRSPASYVLSLSV